MGEEGIKIRIEATKAMNTVECLLYAKYSPKCHEMSISNLRITDEVIRVLEVRTQPQSQSAMEKARLEPR